MSVVIVAIIVVCFAIALVYLCTMLPPEAAALRVPLQVGIVLIAIVILVVLMLRVANISGVSLP